MRLSDVARVELGAEEAELVAKYDKAEVDRLVWHQDEPFASTSIYAQWSVFRLARQNGVTVMLDGQGADEIVCRLGSDESREGRRPEDSERHDKSSSVPPGVNVPTCSS